MFGRYYGAMGRYSYKLGLPKRSTTGRLLRILSYNIQVGIPYSRYRHYLTRSWKHVFPFTGRQENLDSIARFIPYFDVVGLQEVDAGSLRSNYVNQAQYLARQAGFPYWYAQTNRNLGRLAQHSLGLLSTLQPKKILECKLPGRIPGRGALFSEFGLGDASLLIGIIHLALGRKARSQQLDYLARLIRRYEHAILLGDFNCRIDSREFQLLLESTNLCSPEQEIHTYPSWRPRHALDHILVTPGLTVERTRVFQAEYSDHLPIAMDIRLPEDVVFTTEYWGNNRIDYRRESLANIF